MAETGAPSAWIRTMDVETEEPTNGSVEGKIPAWLEGSLIRNGSGIFEIGNFTMNHLFDGFSVLHLFTVSNGRATYRSRILKSESYLTSKAANRLTIGQFGTSAFPDPCKSLLGRFMSRFQLRTDVTDNCSVNVCFFGDKLYAMTETPIMREIDPKTLETIGDKVDISKLVAVHHATAHPHVDSDGTVYNMGNSAGSQGLKYNIIRFPPGGKSLTGPTISASFPSRWKMSHSYYHSFGITENYFIFVEYPLSINLMKLATMALHRNSYASLMEWNPSANTRIMLADRKTGEVLKTVYETKALFCFHHGNAYEEENHVVMDLCSYDDAKIISDLSFSEVKQGKPSAPSRYSRFVLPLDIKASHSNGDKESEENLVRLEGTECKAFLQKDGIVWCEGEVLFNGKIELARINYAFNGKKYDFVYGAQLDDNSAEVSSVVKLNVNTREAKCWSKPGLTPSEPVFVASPNATAEDDGVVLFSALDYSNNQKVILIILNASTFEEEACVEFTAAGVVTKDFHGIFTETK